MIFYYCAMLDDTYSVSKVNRYTVVDEDQYGLRAICLELKIVIWYLQGRIDDSLSGEGAVYRRNAMGSRNFRLMQVRNEGRERPAWCETATCVGNGTFSTAAPLLVGTKAER